MILENINFIFLGHGRLWLSSYTPVHVKTEINDDNGWGLSSSKETSVSLLLYLMSSDLQVRNIKKFTLRSMYSRGYRKEVFLILQILGAITVPAHVLEGIVL